MQKKILSHLIAIIIGAGVFYYFDSNVHEIEQQVIYKDRTRTIVKEVTTEKPDGTKVTERIIDRKEKTDTTASKSESKPVKPDWGVGVKYDLFTGNPAWTVEVNRRIIGNIYGGVYGRTDGIVGAGVTIFF